MPHNNGSPMSDHNIPNAPEDVKEMPDMPRSYTLAVTLDAKGLLEMLKLVDREQSKGDAARLAARLTDTLVLTCNDPQWHARLHDPVTDELRATGVFTRFEYKAKVKIGITPDGIAFDVGGESPAVLRPTDWEQWYSPDKTLDDLVRDQTAEEPAAAQSEQQKPARLLEAFNVHTTQEADVFLRAAADGAIGEHWNNDAKQNARIWNDNSTHHVRVLASESRDLDALARMTGAQDADSCLIALYVMNAVAPSEPLPAPLRRGEWIDLLDVARKTGILTHESREERQRAMRKVWDLLVFGSIAEVRGARSTPYYDKATGTSLSTQIASPVWALGGRVTQETPDLYGDVSIPLRQEILLTKDWERLLLDPCLAQYLPCGELLGAIPAGKVAGAWARVIGLALMNLWRREPVRAIDGAVKPTRRELVTRYAPSKALPQEVLDSANPRRAIIYWVGALEFLVEQRILAKVGEAARSVEDTCSGLPRYGWQDQWLDEHVDLKPGPAVVDAIRGRADKLPKPKPKQLSARRRRTKRGH